MPRASPTRGTPTHTRTGCTSSTGFNTHKGEFGPGSFVWFPEGGWMEHGATAVNDVTLLFITNKPFAICYEQDENHPYPMEK
jgi:hypothetical protein